MDQQLTYGVAYAKSVNKATGSVDAIVSDETVDSYGDVVDSSTWKLARYLKNPVVLHQHRADAPIGQAKNVRVEGGQLHATIVFASTARGQEMQQLYAEGALRAFSVGFRAGRIAEEFTTDGRKVNRLLDCELWEISCVSVPANPSALVKHKAMGLVPPEYTSRDEDGSAEIVRLALEGEEGSRSRNNDDEDGGAAIVRAALEGGR